MGLSRQDTLNLTLGKAYAKRDLDSIRSLIAQGADPIAVVELPGTGGQVCDLLANALKLDDADVLDVIFEAAGSRVDFTRQPWNNEAGINPENMLQYAGMATSDDSWAVVLKHASKHTIDVKGLLNKPIKVPLIINASGETQYVDTSYASYIMSHFDVSLLLNNYNFPVHSEDYSDSHSAFMSVWPLCSKSQRFDISKCFSGEDRLEVIWSGAVYTLKRLFDAGMSLTTVDYKCRDVKSVAQTFEMNSRTIAEWVAFKNKELMCNGAYVQIDENSYSLDSEGRVCFKATISNLHGAHPVEFTIILDFSELEQEIDKMLQSKPGAAVLSMFQTAQSANDARFRRLSAEQRRQAAELDVVPEVLVQRSRPTSLKAAATYDIICKALRARFDAEELKQAGVFQTKLLGSKAKLADNASVLLKALASFSPVGAEVLRDAVGMIGKSATGYLEQQHDREMYEKTVGVSLLHLAIAVAKELSGVVSIAEARDAADKVITQFNSIEKYTGNTKEDLLAFLCAPVLKPKAVIKSHSGNSDQSGKSGSTTVGSQELAVALVADEEVYAPRAGQQNCCVLC